MLITTKAIVLRTVKYSDKASAVTVFTSDYGRIGLVAYGISGRKGSGKAALLQPLSLVELTMSYHPGKELQQLKELRSETNLAGISAHPLKNAIALFIAELLSKTLRQQEGEQDLFDFLHHALEWLNESQEGIANFHIIFMYKLTRFLGFEPNTEFRDARWFDLMNGCYSVNRPLHVHFVQPELMSCFTAMSDCNFATLQHLRLSREQRNGLLNTLLEYYKLHLPEFHTLQSTAILRELFN